MYIVVGAQSLISVTEADHVTRSVCVPAGQFRRARSADPECGLYNIAEFDSSGRTISDQAQCPDSQK